MIFGFFTSGVFAICARAGADFVLLDMEHSGIGTDTVRILLAAARGTGVPPFVRVPGNASHLIAPVLAFPATRWRRGSPRSAPGLHGTSHNRSPRRGGSPPWRLQSREETE